MASLKSLSDEALRRKLLENGITSPVTPSTRNILIKKLNHALAAHKKAGSGHNRARRAANSSRLQTLSSDEEEAEDDTDAPDAHSHSMSSSNVSSRASRVKNTRNSHGRGRGGGEDSYGRGSVSRAGHGRSSGNGDLNKSGSAHFSANQTSVAPDGPDLTTSYRRYLPQVSPRSSRLGSRRVRTREDYDTGSDSDPAENDPRESPGMSRLWASSIGTDTVGSQDTAALNSSALAPSPGQNHNSSAGYPRRSRGMENGREWVDTGGGSGSEGTAAPDTVVSHADPSSRLANGRHPHSECQAEEESSWHYRVPLLLLVLLAVFFGVVAMLYVNMRVPLLPTLYSVPAMAARVLASLPVPFSTPAATTTKPLPLPAPPPDAQARPPPQPPASENKFPVCSSTLKDECLSVQAMALVQPVLGRLEEVVLPALHQRAGRHQCGDAPTRYLPAPDLQDLLQQHTAAAWSAADGEQVVESLGRLAVWNPHWGLEAVRGDGADGGPLLGLALAARPTYILCHITTAIYSFLYLIMGLVTVFITAWLAFSCARYYKLKAEEEKQQMYELVEQILEVLSGLGGASGKDFVAVNHVRDSLISPRDRRTKHRLWERAVQFIADNESRVRREVQAVGGEDCEVWRWASGVPHPHNSPGASPGVDSGGGGGRPPPKVWQGPAFNTLSPHNVPTVSPTSCLKIRNMFDCDVEFGESWPARIQDSILEKCEGISIVHVVVDRTSREGCVYLKCASLPDSGRAFRALHGWWYDGNLVTVKFLRDERYHQRFPSARYATVRLRPSNNKRLSLQQVTPGQPESPAHS